MAIRFSMSEDTSILSSTSLGRKNKNSLEKANFLTRHPQNDLERPTYSRIQTTCKCSNIRAMQLFYEMKQEFPNIPDDVVNQYVLDNIHDPENCKAKLKSKIDSYLVPVQSYPQQLLRVLNQSSVLKKKVKPKNSVLLTNTQVICNNKCSTSDNKDMRSGVCSIQITTYSTDQPKSKDVIEREKLKLPQASQRPTSLNLKRNLALKDHCSQTGSQQELSNKDSIKNKISDGSPFSSSNPPTQKFCKSVDTVTTIQRSATYTDLGKSEIVVNVSLSPSSHRNRAGETQRYQSTVNVRPELPFTRNLESVTANNHKSYTSVNLVLRQPSLNPQSPIDITVGPSLKYSTSSYHSRPGYQNNYQITVTDECGVFSAFRICPINYNSPRFDAINKNDCDDTTSELDVESWNCSSVQSDARKIILRQHKQKERILAVLRKNKNKVSLVHKEVDFAMQTEINDGISVTLDNEIEKLRCDCQTMLNEIENSRKYGLTDDSIQETSTIKSRQGHSFPNYKSFGYPASISNNCIQDQQPSSLPNEEVSSLRHSSITYRDENSNFS